MYDVRVKCFPWESIWEGQTDTDMNTFWRRIKAKFQGHWKDSPIESHVIAKTYREVGHIFI